MSQTETHTFQAEIQQVLDIVIHSLYTDREIFVRELVSNAADACEKLRFVQSGGTGPVHQPDVEPGIRITTDDAAGTLTIADTGIGMTRDELVENLGTIAHSGTRKFLRGVAENRKAETQLIGQFGVGFYSAFMVAKKVVVRTRSFQPDSAGWRWSSEGAGGYTIEPAGDLPRGTEIVLELKDDAKEFATPASLERIVRRYSNFVSFPIEVGGTRLNTVQAIWARSKSEVKEEEYQEFYRYVGHDAEAPMLRLHFSADAPLSIQALLFVPARSFEMLAMGRVDSEVNLHCRKVLIEPKAKGLFPDWLRFLKGVVDSEDLPLNVSRERMQDSELLKKLNRALTNRFLKFLAEEAEKNPDTYARFFAEYQRFIKEGVLSDPDHRDALAKLLSFESSATEPGKHTSLAEYAKRMPADQTEICFLLATNRETALGSPYYEVFQSRGHEVLLVSEPIDEFVLDRLHEFDGKKIVAAEKADLSVPDAQPAEGQLSEPEATGLAEWLKTTLGDAVGEVRVSKRLVGSPAVVLEADRFMTASMKRTLKTMQRDVEGLPESAPEFEINPRHALVSRLEKARHSDPDLAAKAAAQLLDNARLSAGLLEDPRAMLGRINELLERVLAPK
ncbi:MAG: molecular chaperone HtpG [Verrucomicrobia bacterium]|nr:MAG: molecular chaperone HtpG [Verrucomicrobiota bacterium]